MIGSINYTKIVASLGMIVFLGAIVAAGTGAFFNDTETSEGNVFRAGALDLKVDSVGHVNGLVCFDGLWHPESTVVWNESTEQLEVTGVDIPTAIQDYNTDFPANVPQAGTDCASTWELTDLGLETFFEFADLKPGDNGENTISLHVTDNDAYACVIIDDMVDADNDCTEPEADADGEACTVDAPEGDTGGELSQELRFFAWDDDGDNIWEDGEQVLFANTEGPASDVIDGVVYPLFTPATEVLAGETTEYIGLYWCYGDITVDVNANTLSCDGSGASNLTQTDSLTADFTFYVEQARNNENFACPALPPRVTEGDGWSPVDLEGKDWFAKAKLQETNPAADFEVQVGVGDANPADFDQGDTEYPNGSPVAFTLVYDGVDSATFTANGVETTYAVGSDAISNAGITVRAPSDGTTAVDNLVLSTGPLSDTDVSVTGGTAFLQIGGADLQSGFSLSGDLTMTWTTLPSNGENQKMQISIN